MLYQFFRFCQQDFPTSLDLALSSCKWEKLWIISYYLRIISINTALKKNEYIRVLVQRAVCKWLTSRACGQSMSGISLKAEPRPHHGRAHGHTAQEHTAHRLLPSHHRTPTQQSWPGELRAFSHRQQEEQVTNECRFTRRFSHTLPACAASRSHGFSPFLPAPGPSSSVPARSHKFLTSIVSLPLSIVSLSCFHGFPFSLPSWGCAGFRWCCKG